MSGIVEAVNGDGRTGRVGLVSMLKERMSETASGMGDPLLRKGEPPRRPITLPRQSRCRSLCQQQSSCSDGPPVARLNIATESRRQPGLLTHWLIWDSFPVLLQSQLCWRCRFGPSWSCVCSALRSGLGSNDQPHISYLYKCPCGAEDAQRRFPARSSREYPPVDLNLLRVIQSKHNECR